MDRFLAILILAAGVFIGWGIHSRLSEVGEVVVIPSWMVDEFPRSECRPGVRVIPVGGSVSDDICK